MCSASCYQLASESLVKVIASEPCSQDYVAGWLNYFRYADRKTQMKRTDEWLRHRICAVYWKQWKRVRTRYKNLRALHLEEWQVYILVNCRKGTWRASQMLSVALTKKILDKLGYPSIYD